MKINLIHQNTAKFRKADAIKKANVLVVVTSVSLFFLAVSFLAGQLVYYRIQADTLNRTLASIQLTLNSRFESMAAYLRIQKQARTVSEIEAKRVKFKEYLYALYGVTPPSARLSNVNFDDAGVIRVTLRTNSLNEYRSFLENVSLQSENPDFLFVGTAQTKFQRNADGTLQVALEIKVKK